MAQRQRRSEARESIASILDSARNVLAEDPAATMTEIAERSGLHRSTLHRHFASRDALIDALTVAFAAVLEQRIADAGVESGNARDALERATAAWFREAPRWGVVRYAPMGSYSRGDELDVLRKRIVAVLERGRGDGTIRTDVALSELFLGWVALVIGWNAFRADVDDPEAKAREVIRLLLPEPEPFMLGTVDSPARLVVQADGERIRLSLERP